MSLASKTLVVDASIARAAGSKEARHPDAIHARDFLQTLFDAGHKIGMTPAIQSEWNKHQSAFARKWRLRMVATKNFVARSVLEDIKLKDMIDALDMPKNEKSAMLKDCHLLEAAEAFDQRIVSSDDTARDLFRQASATIRTIRKLIWVNSIVEAEIAQRWLKQGAYDEQKWHLQ